MKKKVQLKKLSLKKLMIADLKDEVKFAVKGGEGTVGCNPGVSSLCTKAPNC